jgi:Early Flowering 4 domain
MASVGPADGAVDGVEPEEVVAADWPGVEQFAAVQNVLDANAVLINQINENHVERTPESLRRNLTLVRELNANVARIASLYEALAASLLGDGDGGGGGGDQAGAES